jgi:hypothetical protein
MPVIETAVQTRLGTRRASIAERHRITASKVFDR